MFLCISIGLLSSLQCSAGRKVPHAERYMYLPIYTRLLFRFHFIPHAERFRTQNGSACRTVPRAERFREQNGSARRTVPRAERFRAQNGSARRMVYVFPFGRGCGLYSQLLWLELLAKVAPHPNGKSPPFFDPPPFMRRAGEARRAEPARHGPRAGSKKRGDFSHLGDSPPLAS